MYIDNNDVRTPRERVDGELLRQNMGRESCSCQLNTPCGCNDAMRGTRPVRSVMPGLLPGGFSGRKSMQAAAMGSSRQSDCGAVAAVQTRAAGDFTSIRWLWHTRRCRCGAMRMNPKWRWRAGLCLPSSTSLFMSA